MPASEIKDDLARIAAKREELETLLDCDEEETVILHPNMASYYRQQVETLTKALNSEENRAEAADLIRTLVDRITLTPNDQGKLDIDLFGDLAGILTLAANRKRSLDASDPSVQQVKLVAGIGFEQDRTGKQIEMAIWLEKSRFLLGMVLHALAPGPHHYELVGLGIGPR